MILRMGDTDLEFGGPYLGELRDANGILDDVPALRARMEEDGYLLVRGLHDRDAVIEARRVVLEALNEAELLEPGAPLMDGLLKEGCPGTYFGGNKQVTHSEEVLRVLEGDPIMRFFSQFLEGPALTLDFKWMRVVGPESFTGAHYDVVYMGRGTTNLYTCWTPFSDISLEEGPLGICVGSHRFERIKQTYGKMDVDRDDVHGWFSNDPKEIVDKYGGQWATTTFEMGDVLIFGMYTMHASFRNQTRKARISTDTRYQLATEPVDERWVGENPIAHYAWGKNPTTRVSMEEARARWGV
jgi:hypothetical protein